jgi:MarR family transcriptional regulator, lower aerobic nicotinate degradation pathway regulator
MKYNFLKELIDLAEEFESFNPDPYTRDLNGFRHWIADQIKNEEQAYEEPVWEGKEKGRSPESVINTLIVHMNRYARTYSKSAIHNSDFSTQEEFIYLINLKAFGEMTKMELIKKNIQDKPAGIQIINRLIEQGWVEQNNSESDKRSKIIKITDKGLKVLDLQMHKIRQATQIVTGNLTYNEKMELIRLLDKLDRFHHPIFCKNASGAELLDMVINEHLPVKK